MPKRSLPKRSEVDQLDRAITELLAKPGAKPETGDSELMPLLSIAAQLHQLPRENFKARLIWKGNHPWQPQQKLSPQFVLSRLRG